MIFFTHENFPRLAGEILRLHDFENEIQLYDEIYPKGESVGEWIECIGKQSHKHRPIILSLDDGVRANAVSKEAMRTSKCTFVFLAKAWQRSWDDFTWRLLKAWPAIVIAAQEAQAENRQCKFEVTIKGKINTTNL